MPHPPLAVPEVGRGAEGKIPRTVEGMKEASRRIAALSPDTVIIITPHAEARSGRFGLSLGAGARGDLSRFGGRAAYSVRYDETLCKEVTERCAGLGLDVGPDSGPGMGLDHAFIVPLHYIEGCPGGGGRHGYLRVSPSHAHAKDHYEFGRALAMAAERAGRSAVIVASADLSHRLTADGPYGYAKEGPAFDAWLTDVMKSGDLTRLLAYDRSVREKAAECGFLPIVMAAGALDGLRFEPELLSYEGPFGVGYAVASFAVRGGAAHGASSGGAPDGASDPGPGPVPEGSLIVRLARESLEAYVKRGETISVPDYLPAWALSQRAGAFVSLKVGGELRGCIGTIAPTKGCFAEEVIQNAVSAGTGDPRFPPVTERELGSIAYGVDRLSPPEPSDRDGLDHVRYGVIVTKGRRRGLLLPNLEGVDSVGEQLGIACRKAGIDPREGYSIERFEVVRYGGGGKG